MIRKANRKLGLLVAVAFATCALASSCSPGGGTETPGTIDRVPLFSETTSAAKTALATGISMADINYTIFAPPITRFVQAPSTFTVGKSLDVNLFGTPITLSTSKLGNDIVFSGTVTEKDASGASVDTGSISIAYDPTTPSFEYHSELLITDPNNVSEGNFTEAYAVTDIPRTTINADNSFLAKVQVYVYFGDGDKFQWIDTCELYSGPDDSGNWIVGFAAPVNSDASRSSIASLGSLDLGSMIDANIKPLPAAQFAPIRKNLAAASTGAALATSASEDNGTLLLGYRVYGASGATIHFFNGYGGVSGDGNIYVRSWTSTGYLQDFATSADLLFTPNGYKTKLCLSNVQKLISAFPSKAWRDKTDLLNTCKNKASFTNDL